MKYLRIFESEQIRQQALAQIDYGVLSSAEGVIRINKASGSGPTPQGNDHYIGVIVNGSDETQNFRIMNWQEVCGSFESWEPNRINVDGVEISEISDVISLGPGEHTIEIWDNPENEDYHSMSKYFESCDYISMIIPDYVTSIGERAFDICHYLTSITIPNSVTSIGGSAFSHCNSLTSITIPNSVTSIDYSAFNGCSNLTSITIPNGVTNIGAGAFQECYSLTSITIPNNVTSIDDNTFMYCGGLTSITIPNSVTYIGAVAFQGCTSLTSVNIPDSVTSIDYSAFYGCRYLHTVHCEATTPPTLGENAFYGADANLQIFVPDESVAAYKTAWSSYADCIVSANEA